MTSIDNKDAFWIQYDAPYSALDIAVDGIVTQNSFIKEDFLYIITAATSKEEFNTVESTFEKSIVTFVMEDF